MDNGVDIVLKVLGGLGIVVTVLNYRNQVRIKRAELLKSLFEKFYENSTYKEVRVWLDYGHLQAKLTEENMERRF
jgi:hypothetical protein